MLIPIRELKAKYKLNFRGVIHVGGHWCEEYEDYKEVGLLDQIWIEPCNDAFNEMVKRINGDERVQLVRCACGEHNEQNVPMYVSNQNQGQSNSILIPDLHLTQHPEIKFTDTECIQVRRLDDIEFDRSKYNLLSMDTQGFDGYVVKGGLKTLKHIDYVYTEVNKDSVYRDNTLIEEMDDLLKEFTRVETKWIGNWGDSFYIRKKSVS